MSPAAWGGVAVLGGAGALLRFGLDSRIERRSASEFPLGTLAVNLSGAFVLGLLTGLGLTGVALVLAGTALIGSFTTFSTWMFETERLAEDGEGGLALLNLALGLAAGLACAGAGWALGSLA